MLPLIRRGYVASAVVVGLAFCQLIGCGRMETPRERVVGIWEFSGIHRVVYRKNGSVVQLMHETDRPGAAWVTTAVGKWWLEDNILITDVEIFLLGDTTRRVTRKVIASFGTDRLVSGDGHSDGIRIEPSVARSSQFTLVLRVIAALIALVTANLGVSKSHLRLMFLFFGAGAICMLLSSGFALPVELVQTGDWLTVHLSSLDELRLLRDIFESAAAVFFGVAFIRLALSLRGRALKAFESGTES